MARMHHYPWLYAFVCRVMYLDPSVQLLQSGPQEGPAPRRVFCQDGGRLPRSLPHVQRESKEYRPYRLFLSVPKLYQRVEGKLQIKRDQCLWL